MRWTNCLIRHKSCDHVRLSPALLLTRFSRRRFSVSGIFFGESLQQLPLALASEKFALKFVSVCLYMSFSFVSM